MLELSLIRKNKKDIIERLNKRGIDGLEEKIEHLVDLDDKRKSLQNEYDQTLNSANAIAKEIGNLFKAGEIQEANSKKEQSSQLKIKSKELAKDLSIIENELKVALLNIPNVPNQLVPPGKSTDDNEVISQVEELPMLSKPTPHWDICKNFDLIDFDLGNKVTGAGFPFYKNEGARLIRGMINYFLDEAIAQGYEEIQPPLLINKDSGYATGQLPDKEGQMYELKNEELFLIPTAEVPITNVYRDMIIKSEDLPVKNVGYTACFRREAGSWGAHVRGLNRLHQFDKVEIVQISDPDRSYDALEEMMSHVEQLLQSLELPYRILKLCGGDLGFTSAITYDFEVYAAGQARWLEVSSVSNFETYQSNRLKLRIKGNKSKRYAHTLNGSALAIPRVLAALLENNFQEDRINIPKTLHPYLGFSQILK
ncbi:MAG TPA: serine--tRNA ligase [Cyclobacteriaceae bacterium]